MAKRSSKGLASLIEERPADRALEQLNVSVRVVPLYTWFVLAAAFLAPLEAFGAFSLWYQVPLKLEGRGILLAKHSQGSESLLQVTAPATGRLAKVAVAIGSTVKAGDVLAEIDQKELGDQVASAVAELARLREEDTRMSQLDVDEARSKAEAEGELERALRRSLELDRSRLSTHRRIVAGDQSLKARRLVSDSEALKSQAEADEVESNIAMTPLRSVLYEIAYNRL